MPLAAQPWINHVRDPLASLAVGSNSIHLLRSGLSINMILVITGLTAIESGGIQRKGDIRSGKNGGRTRYIPRLPTNRHS